MKRPANIRRLAIANRGEAAVRCIRSIRSLRAEENSFLLAIALYSAVDSNAPFVRHADIRHRFPASRPAMECYLDHDVLMDAMKRVEADAVWPGWGFLAEDPRFADRVREEGICFLGPSGDAMRAVGDKIAAKRVAERLRVPVADWSQCSASRLEEAAEIAEALGYPLLVKAPNGGGGRGICLVNQPSGLDAAIRSVGCLAAAQDRNILLERKVPNGRHIEVQIAGDQGGLILSLGLRDCSVQRKYQKVIEEAPPLGISPVRTAELEDAAIRLAREVGYVGLGTVEFLINDEGFYFLEMNPRLQVEHGVTEATSGLDLVQLQIRIARGEGLDSLKPRNRGHAIEARICAEDPNAGFLPAPGKITRFEPGLGPGIRIDSGVVTGSEVPGDFDSLIAKVIAWGQTREQARSRIIGALCDFELVVHGGATNNGYLMELLLSDEFRRGSIDNGWLERWNSEVRGPPRFELEALLSAALLMYRGIRETATSAFFADPANISLSRLPSAHGEQVELTRCGESYRLAVLCVAPDTYSISLGDGVCRVSWREEGPQRARLDAGNQSLRVTHDVNDVVVRIEVEGYAHQFGRRAAGEVRSEIAAIAVIVKVSVGDCVEAGDTLVILEAMKTETALRSPVTGVVRELRCRPGQRVSAGDMLVAVEPQRDRLEKDRRTRRLALPPPTDPLERLIHLCQEPATGLSFSDLHHAASTSQIIDGLREEIRHAFLGYDVDLDRTESIAALLEAPLPSDLSGPSITHRAELRRELVLFADVEELFLRTPCVDGSGAAGPSNYERLRAYLRRMQTGGEGMDANFLDRLRKLSSHYDGLEELNQGAPVMLRLLGSRRTRDSRGRLAMALMRHAASVAGVDSAIREDPDFGRVLERIAAMREQVSDAVAGVALETSHSIFEQRDLDQADQLAKRAESWLVAAEAVPTIPPEPVFSELAEAPRPVFDRVGSWLRDPDPRRRTIAQAAYLRRLYAPAQIEFVSWMPDGDTWIEQQDFRDGRTVIGASSGANDLVGAVEALCDTAARLRHSAGCPVVDAIELLASFDGDVPEEGIATWVRALFRRTHAVEPLAARRFSLTVVRRNHRDHHYTFVPSNGRMVLLDLHGLHPEAADRIELERLTEFELERLEFPSDNVHCFKGRSREVPDDERLFVLADVRIGRRMLARSMPGILESLARALLQATAALRSLLGSHDPRRRLHWNRIMLFLPGHVALEKGPAEERIRQLAEAARHLGLEKILVRCHAIDGGFRSAVDMVVEETTGGGIEVSWRDRTHTVLRPATDYERRVAEARQRRLTHPYEIIRMLSEGRSVDGREGAPGECIPAGTFREYDLDPDNPERAVSVQGRPFGMNACSIVFGIISTPTVKLPQGMERVLLLSDPTMGMGALARPECDRIVAALDLAELHAIPVEWVPVSSGARIAMDSGTENLDAAARVARRIVEFTQGGGVINIVVDGVNVGAQSYFDALSTMLMHTCGAIIMTPRGSMVLTGRAALEASGSVSAEDEVAIGGFEGVMGPNGEADYYARDLVDAYRILYQHYRFTYVAPGKTAPERHATRDPKDRDISGFSYRGNKEHEFRTIGEIFSNDTNPERKRPFSMRAIMHALIDQDGGWLERWRSMSGAETAIVWDAHLGGYPVCLIGVESFQLSRDGYVPADGPSAWMGGTLFPPSSKKVARAVNSASGSRPVVVLANLSGFDGSPESMRRLQLEYGAEIARAVVNFRGPILFLVVSRYHGGAYVVFSQALNEGLRAVALEGSYASVIGGAPAAKVVFSREVRAQALADERVQRMRASLLENSSPEARRSFDEVFASVLLAKQAELAAKFDSIHDVERARAVGSIDAIVPVRGVRADLIQRLDGHYSAADP